MSKECQGCKIEIEECYYLQQEGFDAGLEFSINKGVDGKEHCSVFAFNKKGEMIIS